MNSQRTTVSPSKNQTKVVLLCSLTHVITSIVVKICLMQQITKKYNKEHSEFMSEAKNLIRILDGTCAVFLRNTLPDQPKPAVFDGIPIIHKLPEVSKTAMKCKIILYENLSEDTAIDNASEHYIFSSVGCHTQNMSANADKILQHFLP